MTDLSPQYEPTDDAGARARRVAIICVSVVGLMVGAAYASVPLYDLFCRVTGYGGTTNQSDTESTIILDRDVTVRFDSNVARGLNWKFEALQGPQELKVGETGLAFYRATNLSDRPIVGTATYNVTPQKAGAFFMKIECFCFTEQLIEPGQSIDMPVTFYIDPEIVDEDYLDDVETFTLSYTFFEKEGEG
ncbi:MAG: cytochrome c oxidase assembly protein [Alphaproteobacteria bacterium]